MPWIYFTSGSEKDFQIPEWERRACPRLLPTPFLQSPDGFTRRLSPLPSLLPPLSSARECEGGSASSPQIFRSDDGRTEDSSSAKVKAVSAVIRIRVCACGRVGHTPGLNQNLVTAKNSEWLANC